jgi:hypothetical protein
MPKSKLTTSKGIPSASAKTALAKYVFIDVVSFTQDRSVEAQVDIIGAINRIAYEGAIKCTGKKTGTIFLPTGDGVCIAMVDPNFSYDVHIVLSLEILKNIASYNKLTKDKTRRFSVRVGIAENVDNLITDINGKRNVAGAGINTAQRVMTLADGGMILASANVYESLRHREKYLFSFMRFNGQVKHGNRINVYQFIEQGHSGVTVTTPNAFVSAKQIRPKDSKLTKIQAHIIAHAIKHEAFFKIQNYKSMAQYGANALLHFWAEATIDTERDSITTPESLSRKDFLSRPLEKQLEFYADLDPRKILFPLSDYALSTCDDISECFIANGLLALITPLGKKRLRVDWPKTYKRICEKK